MKEKLVFFSVKHPLSLILIVAVILRILAIIFTGGDDPYGAEMGTNCFNYYHIPESWLANPWIVYISRALIGTFSLLIITISYRITKIIADKTTALEIGLLLACFWAAPYLSVHPKPYVMCLPFLLYGTLLIIKQDNLLKNDEIEKFHRTTFLIAGFCLGLGFAVCHLSLVYYIGILITMFILKNWKGALMTLIGYIVAVGLTQTIIDLIIYHRPFVEMTALFGYISDYYSFEGMMLYINAIMAFGVILLMLVVPLSLLLFFGYIRVCKKYLLLFLPTAIVLIYSIFSGMYTTDAILTIIPTYLIAGYVGWKEFYKNSAFWTKNKWLVWTCYVLFALINTILLVISYITF